MVRITINLPENIAKKLRQTAKAEEKSVSRWIAEQIMRDLKDSWPPGVLNAAGAVPEFPSLEQIRAGYGEDEHRLYVKSAVP